MICFVTNQLNISKFLPPQIRKTLISYYIIETKLHQFSKFLLIVYSTKHEGETIASMQNKNFILRKSYLEIMIMKERM